MDDVAELLKEFAELRQRVAQLEGQLAERDPQIAELQAGVRRREKLQTATQSTRREEEAGLSPNAVSRAR